MPCASAADWSALVLRQGAAFVGHRRDRGPDDRFYGYAELHVRSIYLDALLFGMIQRTHIDHLTEDLAQVFTGPGEANRLAHLERRIAHFRSTYWRQHLTTHGAANDLLIAYQHQYRLSARFTEILTEAADHNRLIQTEENQQISGALSILTILGLPSAPPWAPSRSSATRTPGTSSPPPPGPLPPPPHSSRPATAASSSPPSAVDRKPVGITDA